MKQNKLAARLRAWPAWRFWALGYAGVLALGAGLVYFWHSVFMLGNRLPALPFTLGVCAVLSVLYLVFYCISRFGRDNLCLKAALCVFALGLLFCFFTAPLQVPDESAHFLRAHAISQGHFDYDYERAYPADASWLIYTFPAFMNHSVKYQNGQLAPAAFLEYREKVQSGAQPEALVTEPIVIVKLPYLPAALAMAAARLFGFGALGQLYAGRLINLVLYAVLCYFAFRNCDKYRGVFFAAALLPLSIFMAASLSSDGLVLGCCFLAVSYFCKEKIYSLDVIGFLLAVLYAAYFKPTNIVLVAVLLLIPKARWKTNWKPWLAVAGFVLAFAAIYLTFDAVNHGQMRNFPDPLPRGNGEGADVKGQILFVLANPLQFIARTLLSIYEGDAFLFNLGVFGWMDLPIPLVGGLSVLSLAAASALGIQQKEDTKASGAIGLLLAVLGCAGAVLAGIYAAETHLMSIRITGLQPRYFLPAILLFFMLCSILLGKAVRPRLSERSTLLRTEQYTLYIAVAVALLAAVLLVQNAFIGQWLTTGDGSWKLVTLFGWMQT